jgi:hypothetical protein
MRRTTWLVKLAERIKGRLERGHGEILLEKKAEEPRPAEPTGTFIKKQNADWLRARLDGRMSYEIRTWRSVNMRFLRAMILPRLGGRTWLRLLFWLEERFPHFFGEKGQYPLIVIRK